jgi:hypothetical protein
MAEDYPENLGAEFHFGPAWAISEEIHHRGHRATPQLSNFNSAEESDSGNYRFLS